MFPWDDGTKPFYTNEEGFDWYIDKDLTKYCTRNIAGNKEILALDAVVFYVTTKVDGEIKPLSRILIDKKSNQVLADETSLEAMAVKIDSIRLANSYKN